MNTSLPQEIYRRLVDNMEKVVQGQSSAIRKLLAGFITGGHVLLEDNPGTGKTTLAKTLAFSIDARFKRVQFTPDLLPSDIVGLSIYDQKESRFNFHHGPVFTDVLLADEINRASPRTQSALLEAMAERQVTAEGKMYLLDDLFFVCATQNPIENAGTYPLPKAQMDRFALRFSLGYVPVEAEMAILDAQHRGHPIDDVRPCVNREDIRIIKSAVQDVNLSPVLKRYIVELVSKTRSYPGVAIGCSPRASLSLMNISRALAVFDGLEYVIPEHIQGIALDVLAHRLTIDPQAKFSGKTAASIIEELLKTVTVPS